MQATRVGVFNWTCISCRTQRLHHMLCKTLFIQVSLSRKARAVKKRKPHSVRRLTTLSKYAGKGAALA